MIFTAEIDVMPRPELLDPQGKTVANNLKSIQLAGVADVRIGKHITMSIEAADEAEARQKVETACQKLLYNPIMEQFSFHLRS